MGEQYLGKQCWQAVSQVRVQFGTCLETQMKDGWLLVRVEWSNSNITWEKIANVNFNIGECCSIK